MKIVQKLAAAVSAATVVMCGSASAGTINLTLTPTQSCYTAVNEAIDITITIENVDVTNIVGTPDIEFSAHPSLLPMFENEWDISSQCSIPPAGSTSTCTHTYNILSHDDSAAGGQSVEFYTHMTWYEQTGGQLQGANAPTGNIMRCSGPPPAPKTIITGTTAATAWDTSANVCSGMQSTDRGMTWVARSYDAGNNVIMMGSAGTTNPYCGDELCSAPLRMLCVNKTNMSFPSGGTSTQSQYWIGGRIGVTSPIRGDDPSIQSQAAADAFCAAELGAGWEMAEHHDTRSGWNIQGVREGFIPGNERFWAAIRDQSRGNCWN